MKHKHLARALVSATCLLACERSEPASGPTTNSITKAIADATATASSPPPPTKPNNLSIELLGDGTCDGKAPHDGSKASLAAQPSGSDVKLTVKNVHGYCKTVASYSARLDGKTIHVTRAKPTAVSRCTCAHDLVLVVHGVPAGASTIVYEEEPYASDDGVATIASGVIERPPVE